jgi:hypothetical protein
VPDWNVNEAHRQEIKRLKKYLSKRELMADYFEDNRAKKTEKE